MTWGRGGSTNVVQVTTRARRAYSLPAEDVVVPTRSSFGSRAYHADNVVNYARSDIEDVKAASRRHDQALLNDITTRLANAPFAQPVEVRSRSRGRPRAPSAPVSRRGSISSYSMSEMRTSVPSKPKSLADEDFEINFPPELRPKPLPPCVRRAQSRSYQVRSASVPPSPPSREEKIRSTYKPTRGGFIDLSSPLFRLVDAAPSTKPSYKSPFSIFFNEPVEQRYTPVREPLRQVPLPKRRYSYAFDIDAEDDFYPSLHTPQWRTASSYGLTIPRPYVRKHTSSPYNPYWSSPYYQYDRRDYVPESTYIASGFRATSEPRQRAPVTRSSGLAVRQARASLGRIERELGMGSVTLGDEPVYLDEPIITTTPVVPVRATRTGFLRGTTVPVRRQSYGGTYGRPPPAPRSAASSTRQAEIQARVEAMVTPEYAPPPSYSTLRSRTQQARNKMDQHKTLLDRYLPLPVGTPNEVPYEVEYKFQELANRMPSLRPREPRDNPRASSLPPYRPAGAPANRPNFNQYNDSLRRAPFVPHVSDTRKRAREVLCRTKRDPHYFDY